MAEIVAQQPGAADLVNDMGAELYAHRLNVKAPEPNPDFSFPRLQNSDDQSSESARKPRIRPQNLAILPAPSPELPSGSPGKTDPFMNSSPGKRPLSSRGMGHRREGSQFIGGDGKNTTGTGVMSSSPTKPTSNLPSPPSSVGRRRGHAHRRSGAMSTNDFSAFLNSTASSAPPVPVPGSAPTTPMVPSHEISTLPRSLERAQSQPSMTAREKIDLANAVGAMEDQELASTPRSSASRPKVGFSEKIEFIPRPLSIISSDTASSMSTVRASHSASGSISSMLDQRPATPVFATTIPEDRPGSSGSAEEPFFGAPEEAEETGSQRPTSASGKALFSKRRRSPPPAFTRYDDASPGSVDQPFYFASESLSDQISPTSVRSGESDSPEKDTRRESRGRSLASRLLRRRPRSKEDDIESPPPVETTATNVPDGLLSLDDVNFDEDTSLVIHSAGYTQPVPAAYQPSPSPVKETFDKDDSAALDLDLTYNSVKIDEDSPNSFANIMKGTIRQHRRTESAPSLSPIQRHGFVPNKPPGSPHKMADVFEEEEEEDSPPRQKRPKALSFTQPKRRADLQGLGVQIVDKEAGEGVQPRRKSRSPSSKAESTTSEKELQVPEPVNPADGNVREVPIEVSNIPINKRFSMATKSSDEETITPSAMESPPASRARDQDKETQSASSTAPHPLDFAPPPTLLPHAHHDSSDLSSASSVPSPNPTNLSFDGPRLNTAASSITDRTTWSSNHPQSTSTCPDSGQSTEDVPSLTSSASTMMSGHPSHVSHHSMAGLPPVTGNGTGYHAHTFSGTPSPAFAGVRPQSTGGERTFSFSGISPRPRRNWSSRPSTASNSKRASLASLSRLMSKGTDSEKSKLSMTWGAQDVEAEAKKEKESKGKRLSRALKFWKSKEKLRDAS